ncbi:reverse transcriptase domain-containing protein [Tanacetum coccineum]
MEHGSERMKSPEKIEEEDVDTQKEMKEVIKESGAKRKKYLPRKRSIVKRQKLEEDAEKEELKGFLDIIPREDVAEDVESLSTKYPIMDWNTYTLTENFMYYQIFRGDGSSKNYKVLSEPSSLFDFEEVMSIPHNSMGQPPTGPPPPNNTGSPLVGDDANRHIDKFLEITQHMKQNEVSNDALRLSLFPYSLTHHAIAWYDRLPRNSIHSFDDMMRKFLSKYFPPSMVTKLRNEIMKFEQKSHESLFEA